MTTSDSLPSPVAPVPLPIAEALTIYSVAALAAEWRPRLKLPGPFVLDLASVTACDSVGLQLLCATKRAAEAAGRTVQFRAPSGSVNTAAAAIAADDLFAPNSIPR